MSNVLASVRMVPGCGNSIDRIQVLSMGKRIETNEGILPGFFKVRVRAWRYRGVEFRVRGYWYRPSDLVDIPYIIAENGFLDEPNGLEIRDHMELGEVAVSHFQESTGQPFDEWMIQSNIQGFRRTWSPQNREFTLYWDEFEKAWASEDGSMKVTLQELRKAEIYSKRA